jgi:predicted signal transduction protein with EAL and GGDEF domain
METRSLPEGPGRNERQRWTDDSTHAGAGPGEPVQLLSLRSQAQAGTNRDMELRDAIQRIALEMAGDAALRETAEQISHVVRSYDFVGRYGGEGFLVVLPGCDKDQAEQSGERIRLAVHASPVVAAGTEIPVTVSIGATATARGAETEVLAIADAAMYEAKNTGRNRTVVR